MSISRCISSAAVLAALAVMPSMLFSIVNAALSSSGVLASEMAASTVLSSSAEIFPASAASWAIDVNSSLAALTRSAVPAARSPSAVK